MSTPAEQALERIAIAQARRKALVDSEREARVLQQADDIEAIVELEELHGSERVLRIELDCWAPNRGAATCVAVLLPEAGDHKFKRFQQIANRDELKPAEKVDASDVLARSCIVYPHPKDAPEMYKATVSLSSGILAYVTNQIITHVRGRLVEEGK